MTEFAHEKGLSYAFIPTDRFKTTLLSVGFYTALSDNAAVNSLATALMSSGTVTLPDFYSFNRKLASLYGAGVSVMSSKLGDTAEIRISIMVNDDKYSINGESTVTEAGKLLLDMVFGRLLENTDYPEQIVTREKRLLSEKISGKLNDKRIFARKRAEEIMCKDEPFGLSVEGTKEQVLALTPNDVSAAIKELVKSSFISVIAIGNTEPSCFKEDFKRCILSVDRNYKPLKEQVVKPAGELKECTEKMPVKQGKLVLGLRSNSGGNDLETINLLVMNDVFGGGPYSKLFCNVREKMSLCYYCSARAIRKKGLIFVESGVEEQNIAKAKEAILCELKSIAEGDFTEENLNASKLALCDAINSVEADQGSLLQWYSSRATEQNPISPKEMCDAISKVTAKDICNAAKSFALDTVYILLPDGSIKEDEE